MKQKALHPYEDPVLLSSAIDARIEDLRKPFNRLKNKKKPKPPPAPKPSNSTANETASDSASEPVEEETLQEEDASWEDQPLAQDSEGKFSVSSSLCECLVTVSGSALKLLMLFCKVSSEDT